MKALILAIAFLPLGLRADHVDFVTVSATASPLYLKDRMAAGSPQRQTYALYQGKFFSGTTRDPSIERMSFPDLARALAPTLAEQNFFPARTARSANLLIVINWGTTLPDYWSDHSDPENQFLISQLSNDLRGLGNTQPGEIVNGANVNFDREMYESQGWAAQNVQSYNAMLLGYGPQLVKDATQDSHQTFFETEVGPNETSHRYDLIDERYFVVLLAYDYQDILRNYPAGKAPAHRPPPRPVWEVRMNVQAAGNNFTQALPAMARVASAYYGRNIDGLATLQTDMDHPTRVEIGASRVMGVVK